MTSLPLLRWQGGAFSVLAAAVALSGTFWAQGDRRLEVSAVVILIFFLGVPHGALDTVFARRAYALGSVGRWLIFSGAYLLMAALVVGLWWQLPAVFLSGFLLVSAFHFSGDPVHGTPRLLRFWYGGAVILLPAMLHEREVAVLFGYLVLGDFPVQLAALLHWLAVPWLVGLTLSGVVNLRRDVWTSVEVMAVAWLMSAATPLIAFTVFFCLMHSARHALRTQKYAGQKSLLWLVKQAALPMVASLLIAALAWPVMASIPFDAAVLRLLFVALAALTVPHMWLVERLRFSRAFLDAESPGVAGSR